MLGAGGLILVVWMVLGVDIWRFHVTRIENAQAQAASVVQAMSERVQRIFRLVDHSLKAIEIDFQTHLSASDPRQIARHLQMHAPHLDAVLTIAFDDATGLCIAQSNPAIPTGRDYANSESFRVHVTRPDLGLYIEQPKIGPSSGQKVFTLSRRVTGKNGEFLGVVAAPIRSDVMAAAFESVRIGVRGSVALVHLDSRRVIARQPEFEKTFAASVQPGGLFDELERAPNGRFEFESAVDGERRLFTYSKIEGLPLAIVVGVSVDDINAQLMRDLGGYFALAMLFSLIVAGGAGMAIVANRRELALLTSLAEKDALIGAFFGASPVGMYMLDKDLKYSLINQALAGINGVGVEQTLGHTTRDILPALGGQLEPVYEEIVATGEAQKDIDITGTTAGDPGEFRHWQLSNFPIRDARGAWLGIGGVVLEVTEKRRAERALKRWQDIFEHAEWGVTVCSADGTTLELVNPAFAKMCGYSVEELTGQSIDLVFAPEAREQISGETSQVHAEGHRRFESLHQRRDGSILPVLIDATTVRNDAGEVLYRIVNVQDITGIRQAHEEMRIAREFFENVFRVAPVGKAVADLTGRYIKVNRAMCEFVGYSESELLAMSFQDITHPEDLDRNLDLRDRMLVGEIESFKMEKRFVHKDGRAIWALLVVTEVRDSEGRPLYTIGQMMDIDQRKRAEDALMHRDRELQEALRVGKIGSWDLDARSYAVTWSEQLCKIVGHDPARAVPDNAEIHRYYRGESMVRHKAAIDRAIASGEPYELEVEIVLASGRPGWLLVRGEAVRDAEDKVARLRGTAQDITERKEWELALEQTREQLRALSTYHEKELEEERRHIAREVHDELGQFLTALKMDISLLRLRFGDDPDLRGKVEDMRGLVEQTIQVVRHVASNLRPAALDLGLVPAIEWLAEDFGHRWEIVCRVDLSGAEITLDDIHATAVFRVVQESLTNVARHAGASAVTISLDAAHDRLQLSIRDNGRGFDPAAIENTRSYGLLGMRERMLGLGGALIVDSATGKGTTVTIYLPIPGATA
jgi:PAS domain S-box-containing protein